MANAPKRSRAGRPAPAGSFFRGPVALWFALGLLCRLVVFTGPHAEGDELVYRALVYQLEAGRGYNLIGSPLIGHGWPADQYGNALFRPAASACSGCSISRWVTRGSRLFRSCATRCSWPPSRAATPAAS